MKLISMWQPWASLWLSPCKIHETRHWRTDHRGWLAVHATKKIAFDIDPELRDLVDDEFGPHWRRELPRGVIIGAVFVDACTPTALIENHGTDDYVCGDFSHGRWGIRRREYRGLANPIPFTGRQGKLLTIPDAMLADIVSPAELAA